MIKKHVIAFSILLSTITAALAEVRFNPATGLWEGNICANNFGWTYYQWQPIGSLCLIRLPNGVMTQGIIIRK